MQTVCCGPAATLVDVVLTVVLTVRVMEVLVVVDVEVVVSFVTVTGAITIFVVVVVTTRVDVAIGAANNRVVEAVAEMISVSMVVVTLVV